MRKKQDPISLPKRIVLGASLILASTYTVAWAGNTQNETPHHHAIESITQVKTVTGVVTDQYGTGYRCQCTCKRKYYWYNHRHRW